MLSSFQVHVVFPLLCPQPDHRCCCLLGNADTTLHTILSGTGRESEESQRERREGREAEFRISTSKSSSVPGSRSLQAGPQSRPGPSPEPHACKTHLFLCFLPGSYSSVVSSVSALGPPPSLDVEKERFEGRPSQILVSGRKQGPDWGRGLQAVEGGGRERERRVSGTKATWLCFLVRSLVIFLPMGIFMGSLAFRVWEGNSQRYPSLLSQLAAGLGRTFRVGIYQPLE